MHQIVHLDLKGAPPNVSYIEKVLVQIKKWGASGILLEWEDTFPYTGELVEIGSLGNWSHDDQRPRSGSGGDGLYSIKEVKHIIQFAKELGVETIQLIQTIGHMEFVLKHPALRSLREAPRSPAALCPSRPESRVLVRAMLEQALMLQPEAKYLHIGADEVWHTGICDKCKQRVSRSEYKSASLYLEHIRDTVLFIKKLRPDITVLMWDDMLRSICLDTLKAYNLGDLVQPVVWHYNPAECFNIDRGLWDVYRQIFPAVWAGSAFKGANGSCQVLSPVSRYVSNHEAWLREMKANQHHIVFKGVILTGWSRFDHYATLCELLPVSLPSLASCLRVLGEGQSATVCEVLESDQWPGEQLARCVHSYVILRERCLAFLHGDLVTTWLNPWQLEHNFTNPTQIEGLALNARHLTTDLSSLTAELSSQLHSFTGKRSTEEWLATFIAPISVRLTDVTTKSEEKTRIEAGVRPVGY